ncbi:hypothetical protein ACIBKY_51490 [Nonomuraea sp. NPDC050394]|uniref:hypothetical protein n=1 Tax=Nonomuraea sp. NPDC050394 TaxID=3364363 RepID=UPI0037AC882D
MWLDLGFHLVDGECRRAHWTANTRRFLWQLALNLGADRVTLPGFTWEKFAAEVGVSLRTISDRFTWARRAGLIGVVTPGSTPESRNRTKEEREADTLGHLAGEYVAIVPDDLLAALYEADALDAVAVREAELDAQALDEEHPWPCETLSERPTFYLVKAPVDETCVPAVDLKVFTDLGRHAGPREASVITEPTPSWPSTVSATTRADALRLCERLKTDNGLFKDLSVRDLRSLTRHEVTTGATVRDIEHALNVRPGGDRWGSITDGLGSLPKSARIRILRSRFRARLNLWCDDDGQLTQPWPSQIAAAAAARRRADQAAWRASQEVMRRAAAGGPIPLEPQMSRAEALAPCPPEATVPVTPNEAFRQAVEAQRARVRAEQAERRAYLSRYGGTT